MGAGAVIHAVADNQDFRKYGGLILFLPLTYSVILIASLSLVAFPAELFWKLLKWGEPSNFGDALKFLIPSCSWKTISGLSNYSGMVASQKMMENEMGNRGSKSIADNDHVSPKSVIVKEQWVDGGWHRVISIISVFKVYSNGFRKKLSYLNPFKSNKVISVMGYSNYHLAVIAISPSGGSGVNLEMKNLSTGTPLKGLFIRRGISCIPVSNLTSESQISHTSLSPWWVTGFSDAEGCFRISILKNKELKIKWGVRAFFQISLHGKDKALLELIRLKLGVGKIYTAGPTAVTLEVHSIKELEIIIQHFDKYPLITKKRADYELFKLAVDYIKQGLHLTNEGLIKIIGIKASMNRGLPDELKTAFERPDAEGIIPTVRALVQNLAIPDPQWVAGFMSGEGCLIVRVRNSRTHKTGLQVELVFQLTQHTKDKELLIRFKKYFGCGRYRERIGGLAGDFYVTRLSDLNQKIIPFFFEYPIIGTKAKNFKDFAKVAQLMQNKAHLTEEGLEQIKNIKAGMNRGRII